MKTQRKNPSSGFTLVEILIVIGLIVILAAIAVPAMNIAKERANVSTHVANLRELTLATLQWASENGQILPSPKYPGGHTPGSPSIPESWNFVGTGTGLWLDGVVYYAIHPHQPSEKGSSGAHLKDTILFSEQSHRTNPTDQNWYRHSYAMNRSLQHNPLYATSRDPELTSKNLGRLTHRSQALLFTENEDSNVVGFQDRKRIIETAEKRWSSGKAVSSFLDGSVRLLAASDFPSESRRRDRESCHFWSGVRLASFSCGSCHSKGNQEKKDDSDSGGGGENEGEGDEEEEEEPSPYC